MTTPRIGLAISGGGYRATAFGLGCLRALHDRGILDNVTVVSGISGGSLAAALWAYGPDRFDDFDAHTVGLLRRGIQLDITRRAFTPAAVGRNMTALLRSSMPTPFNGQRTANRTDALRDTLAELAFGDTLLDKVTHPRLATVISATDLHTTRAVRFGSQRSSCSVHGTITDSITVAQAVAASAAFPLLLPAIERTFTFTRNGETTAHRVALTDGGVYDNLGLSVLEPGRSSAYTDHVYDLDYIIACDAGAGAPNPALGRFLPTRLYRAFNITYRKTQDAGRARLHEAARTGQLRGFVHSYLGMPDHRLPIPVPDLIACDRVRSYGTNFKGMKPDDLHAISTRGEQLTRTLIAYYCPNL
ncbi:patatin-like phospholipase family protein [Dactylosporangium sp. CA-233914]|uniref:patatin-like phospholipase family protein n=1 Tax=Dactylosporangium sp. CA-233914 TaxID=3239934 RepID=UPI003D8B9478